MWVKEVFILKYILALDIGVASVDWAVKIMNELITEMYVQPKEQMILIDK